MKKPKFRKNSLAVGILKAIGLAGLVIVAASSPYFGLGLIRGMSKHYDKKAWRKFYASLDYLDRRGWVKILSNQEGQLKVKITRQGEDRFEAINIETMQLSKDAVWDDKWRVIIFDVPNYKSQNRLAFTEKLKTLGFVMVQKSVWAYPFECYKEIAILRKFYEIERYVTYFKGIEIEDEKGWRGKFNLINQT